MAEQQYPKVPLYLFFGTQTEAILSARDTILSRIVPPDFRNENLTEYFPSASSDTIKFAPLLDEIAGDLAMVSFIPDAAKCVVVTNPAEIYGSAGGWGGGGDAKKADKAEKAEKGAANLTRWLEHELPQTGHTIILVAFEDESNLREVDQKSALYQTVMKVGYLRGFSDTKAFFRIEDALVRRQGAACIAAIRDLWKSGKGDMRVYNAVARALRFLMQANIARERKMMDDPARQMAFFPGDGQRSIFKAHPNVRAKYTGRPLYRTKNLLKAYQGTLDVYRALRPRPGDDYVPDARGLLEHTLLELIASPLPPG